jgi:predicted lipid-binding transport protein (Tim44 family)
MELDTNVLTILVVLAFAFWRALAKLEELRSRASRQLRGLERPAADSPADPRTDDLLTRMEMSSRCLNAGIARRLEGMTAGSFRIGPFLDDALVTYETVVTAFANGNRGVLRQLVSADVYEIFSQAITEREARRETSALTFILLKPAVITGAGVAGNRMQVTVCFESEYVSVTRDEKGEVVGGDPAQIVAANDLWTFAKDADSSSSAWLLVATESSQTAFGSSEDGEALNAEISEVHDRARASEKFRTHA